MILKERPSFDCFKNPIKSSPKFKLKLTKKKPEEDQINEVNDVTKDILKYVHYLIHYFYQDQYVVI